MNNFLDEGTTSGSYYTSGDYYCIINDDVVIYHEDYMLKISSSQERIYYQPSTKVEIYSIFYYYNILLFNE